MEDFEELNGIFVFRCYICKKSEKQLAEQNKEHGLKHEGNSSKKVKCDSITQITLFQKIPVQVCTYFAF